MVLGAVGTALPIVWLVLGLVDWRSEAKAEEARASIAHLARTIGESLDLHAPQAPSPFNGSVKSGPPN